MKNPWFLLIFFSLFGSLKSFFTSVYKNAKRVFIKTNWMGEISLSSLDARFPYIKPYVFKFSVGALLAILNSYIFRRLLNVNNNFHFFTMILVSRSIHFILVFFYDESKLFKSALFEKNSFLDLLDKFKIRITSQFSLENILVSLLLCIICVMLKKFIIGLDVLDFNRLFNLCLLAFFIMISSALSKYVILRLIKRIRRDLYIFIIIIVLCIFIYYR